jgi:hypothetical protein
LKDLIEDATTIFQFKVESNYENNVISFKKWLKEKRLKNINVYSNVFHLLSLICGEETAYVTLPGLVQASFYSTYPHLTFISLVNHISDYISIYRDLDTETSFRQFLNILKKLENHYKTRSEFPHTDLDPKEPVENDPYCFLDYNIYSNLINKTNDHAIFPLAKEYIKILKDRPRFEYLLFHPTDFNFSEILENFSPPLISIRFHYEFLNARDSLGIINSKLVGVPTEFDPYITYDQYLPEMQKRKDLAYSLVTDINNIVEHNCHHNHCPYYYINLCRRWTAIPKEYSQCSFPTWFQDVTHRKINLDTNKLNKC